MASVTVNNQDLSDIRFTLSRIRSDTKLAAVRATNDALRGIQSEATRLIRGKVTLTATVIRQRFSIRRMSVSNLNAAITCQGNPVPLINYTARQVRGGVTVRILRATSRKTIPHAFVATMRSGHRGAFWREWDRFRVPVRRSFPYGILAGGQYAKPIRELYGPRVPDFLDDPDIMTPVLANANIRLQARLEHHTNRLIENAR